MKLMFNSSVSIQPEVFDPKTLNDARWLWARSRRKHPLQWTRSRPLSRIFDPNHWSVENLLNWGHNATMTEKLEVLSAKTTQSNEKGLGF